MRELFKVIIVLLPWCLRRLILVYFWKYEIHPSARIGYSFVYPKRLVMKEGSRIDHFTMAIHLDHIEIGRNSKIGRSNWITGFPTGGRSKHFLHQVSRKSELIIGEESAITKGHHIDCTNQIHIGSFVTIAGYKTQILTHSIDIVEGRQDSKPVVIGDYCFVGTSCILLGGAALPDFSVLAAGSMLAKKYENSHTIYGGVPARAVKTVPVDCRYFTRKSGFVY